MNPNDADESAEPKKPRHRSPNYPAVSLREAVDRARKLYQQDGKAGAPADLAAVHIGFTTAHGQAMSVLAALKRFGLISESNGRMVPTQRAMEIINLPVGDGRRAQALRDAAFEPIIYKELIEQHRETGWPSPSVLESELITYRNFNPKVVKDFVRDLFDSLEFSGLSDLSALDSGQEDLEPDQMETLTEQDEPRTSQQPIALLGLGTSRVGEQGKSPSKLSLPVGPPNRQDVFSLPEGTVTIQWPTNITVESFQDVTDWLEIVKRKIGRSVSKGVE